MAETHGRPELLVLGTDVDLLPRRGAVVTAVAAQGDQRSGGTGHDRTLAGDQG